MVCVLHQGLARYLRALLNLRADHVTGAEDGQVVIALQALGNGALAAACQATAHRRLCQQRRRQSRQGLPGGPQST